MANIINQINVGGTTYDVGAAAANVSVDPASAGVESTALEPALKEIPDNTINKYNANNLADNLTTGTAGTKALDAHQGSIIQTQTNNIMDIVYGKTTRAYAEGDFFMLNNKPYCASTTIAADTTLTDSTVINYATLLSESATNVLAGQIAQINKTLNDKIVSNSEAISTNTNNISKNTADITALNNSLANLYPVGAIYLSTTDASPASFFGGTWERLKDRFLLAAGDSYAAGSTGGEEAHTLTVDEMPSHSHTVNNHTHSIPNLSGTAAPSGGHTHGYNPSGFNVQGSAGAQVASGTSMWGVMAGHTVSIAYAGNHTHSVTTNASTTGGSAPNTNSQGGNTAHNNMPPYIAVYMWKRVA